MTMQRFNRGLSDDFVHALNEEYRKGGWWRNLVDDRETFLAIRDAYVNVYYRGCSLLKLRHDERGLRGEVHYKYLMQPELGREYISVVDGIPNLEEHGRLVLMTNLANVHDLKRAAEPFAGDEKGGVDSIIHRNPSVLDVEIDVAGRDRIDLAALRRREDRVEVRFYEAKLFSNKDLRSEGTPKVMRQMQNYARALQRYCADIGDSYVRVCRNLSELAGVAGRHRERDELLKSVAEGSAELHIDTEPRLLVFGFDADQRDGQTWRRHREKLHQALPGRVFMVGNPKNFTLPR